MISLPFMLFAAEGNLMEVTLENEGTIVIAHQDCNMKATPIRSDNKLIIPLENCEASAGQIPINNSQIEEVHWAQHDTNIVWIVITFVPPYRYEFKELDQKYKVCVPSCDKVADKTMKSLTDTTQAPQLFSVGDIAFHIPIKGMDINQFIEHSIGYDKMDLMRDGLPDFDSVRDDWLGTPRKHEGYDIYTNKATVIAAAAGKVVTIGRNRRAGIYVKLHHGDEIYTVYVHLRSTPVKEGQKVKQGDTIGIIDGAAGNAATPQLHFEIKIDDTSVDPLPFIETFYRKDSQLLDKIKQAKEKLQQLTQLRAAKVKAWLETKH
ncbi:MAG: M23 family metallopeptidase [Thiotrichaceae bacterium]